LPNPLGILDFRLASLFQAWGKANPSPSWVQPLPLSILCGVVELAHADGGPALRAAADCATFAFYFLLRPGKYAGTPRTCDNLFRLCNVAMWAGDIAIYPSTCPLAHLNLSVTFVSLTFTQQKNSVCGETVGHSCSGNPTLLCPVSSIVSRIHHLRQHAAPPDTLNASSPLPSHPFFALLLPSPTHPSALIAPFFQPGPLGLVAPWPSLVGRVDTNCIRLIGRWRLDEMYRYLHVQFQPTMSGIATAMLCGHAPWRPPPFLFSHPSGLATLLPAPHPSSRLAPLRSRIY
jgi:hypothetical protein